MKTVLILEDSVIVSRLLSALLTSKGYDVVACDSVSGLGAVNKRLDYAVLDYQLPDGNGLEVARRLKSVQPSLPMMLLTARGGSVPMLEASSLGITDLVEKPVNSDQILGIIKAKIG